MSQAIETVPTVCYVCEFLFFAGLVDFLFSVNDIVAPTAFVVFVFFGAIYLLLAFLQNVRPNCPYRTPFSLDVLQWLLFPPTAPVLLTLAVVSRRRRG